MTLYDKLKWRIEEIYSLILWKLNRYRYDDNQYPETFIGKNNKILSAELNKAQEVIYVFWTGENKLTANRASNLDILRKYSGVEIILVTPINLEQFIVADNPIHEGYQYLSLNHRSDYLRAYFMYHYGGGYTDIKCNVNNWKSAFDELNSDGNKWFLGYQEVGRYGVNNDTPGRLGKDLKKYYKYLMGNGAFIFKPKSPAAKEWLQEIHNKLDVKLDILKINPAKDFFGQNDNYPFIWGEFGGNIQHPVGLKYHDRVRFNKLVLPSMKNYR